MAGAFVPPEAESGKPLETADLDDLPPTPREASVDEVAAAHMQPDLIVHFGPATLAPTASSIPVLHIFGQRPFDVDDAGG